jgi:hypothetical protein
MSSVEVARELTSADRAMSQPLRIGDGPMSRRYSDAHSNNDDHSDSGSLCAHLLYSYCSTARIVSSCWIPMLDFP